jgi:hypothetical protein
MNYNLQLRIIEILEVIDKTINTNRYGQVRYNERQFDIIPGIGLSRIIVQKGEELKQEIRNQYGDELAELEKKIDIIRNIKNQDYSIQSELISPYFFDESFMKEIVIKDPHILDGLSVRLIIDQGINWENGFNKLATHAINTPHTNTNFEHLIYCMTNGFPKYGNYDYDQVRISNQGHEYNRNELNEILKQHYKRNLILDLLENNGQMISSIDYEANDQEIALTALLNSWETIEKLPQFQDDLLCCLFAIHNNGHSIKYISDAFKDNEAIVEFAILKSRKYVTGSNELVVDFRSVYPYISDRLKENEDLALRVSKKDGMLLQHMSDTLKNSFKIVKSCIINNGLSIQFASPELRSNKELIDEAIKQNPAAVNHIAPENR